MFAMDVEADNLSVLTSDRCNRTGGSFTIIVAYVRRPLEAQLANLECNATSAVQITHHFLGLMVRPTNGATFLRTIVA